MNKPISWGLLVGGIFALAIVYGAAFTAIDAGGAVLLATAVDGLVAAVCIAGLILANFALAGVEEKEAEAKDTPQAKFPTAA